MDLSLEFGNPSLAKVLTERQFGQWADYSRIHHLPTRRIELYLAQIAMLIATTMGGAKDVTLHDFLFDPPVEIDPVEQLKAAKEAFGFKPRKKRGQ